MLYKSICALWVLFKEQECVQNEYWFQSYERRRKNWRSYTNEPISALPITPLLNN